jgi:hypothetical protein
MGVARGVRVVLSVPERFVGGIKDVARLIAWLKAVGSSSPAVTRQVLCGGSAGCYQSSKHKAAQPQSTLAPLPLCFASACHAAQQGRQPSVASIAVVLCTCLYLYHPSFEANFGSASSHQNWSADTVLQSMACNFTASTTYMMVVYSKATGARMWLLEVGGACAAEVVSSARDLVHAWPYRAVTLCKLLPNKPYYNVLQFVRTCVTSACPCRLKTGQTSCRDNSQPSARHQSTVNRVK